MLRQLARDTVVYTLAGSLSRVFSALVLPVYARALAPAQLGNIDMLLMLGGVASIAVALEISQGFARYHSEAGSPQDALSFASTAFWFTIGTFTIFALAGSAMASQISRLLLRQEGEATLVRVALAAFWTQALLHLLLTHLRYGLRPSRFALVSLTSTAVAMSTACILVWPLKSGPVGVFYGMVLGNLVGLSLGLAWSRADIVGRFDLKKSRLMLAFSLPLVPAGLIGVIGAYIDRISIQHFMTQADVGVFGAGFRIASVGAVVLVGMQMAFVPLLYNSAARPEAPAEIGRVFQYFVGAAALFCITIGLFSQELTRFVLTPAYAKSAGVIPLLAPAVIFANMTMFAPGLSLAKRTRQLAVVVSIGALANAALNTMFVPLFGIRGAALSTLLSAAATFGVLLWLSQRYFTMPLRALPLVTAVLVTLVICASASLLQGTSTSLFVAKVIVWVAALTILLLARLVDVDELRKIRLRRRA